MTKQNYYQILDESKVQFNCADQDWVSFTLLEAVTFGCHPVYPDFRSFPEVFTPNPRYVRSDADKLNSYTERDMLVYRKPIAQLDKKFVNDYDDKIAKYAKGVIDKVMMLPDSHWDQLAERLKWIVAPHDDAIHRMANVMGLYGDFKTPSPPPIYPELKCPKKPPLKLYAPRNATTSPS